MSYRVLIPTAGTGSRLKGLTRYVNKALVGIANRPTISHIIEQFPQETEFVIALGHKGHLIREFLTLAYPKQKFFFVEVHPFEGPGSGLGLSVLHCKDFLQQPFIFTSCDTLVRQPIPKPDQNWMGCSDQKDIDQYRTLETNGGQVKAICEKGIGRPKTHLPYIGLAGIHDYEAFWEAMESGGDEAIAMGEAYGMRRLVSSGIRSYCFDWYDTGNPESLAHTRNIFREKNEPNILEKANEAIWFVDGLVIKFSDDEKFIKNRVSRSRELADYVPEVSGATQHMYCYPMAEGQILSEAVTLPLFKELLRHSMNFWKPLDLSPSERVAFRLDCMKFYKAKTLERIELFYTNFQKKDGTEAINGLATPTLSKLLDALNWDWLTDGLPGRFHGDFHFENILYSKQTGRFTFLDWRQEFGGSLTCGDIYYDLAKLLHGLIICHELIAANHFSIEWDEKDIRFDFYRKQILVECERSYYEWLEIHNFDRRRVRVLTALVFLNIAALHHFPYCLLLYSLGKKMLLEITTTE